MRAGCRRIWPQRIGALAPLHAHPMATLQAITPLLAQQPPSCRIASTDDEHEALIVAARLPAAYALLHSLRAGRAPGLYPVARRYGQRVLEMLRNCAPTAAEVRVFERTQILQLDHSFNASTFTARVVTSTLAPPASALGAAMGSLYGPLHGAADQGALEWPKKSAIRSAPQRSWRPASRMGGW